MQIGELAQRSGLTVHAIRFYEKEGLLDKRFVRRGENNYRYYSEEAVERLALLKQAQTIGFTLAEVKELAAAYDAGSLTMQQQITLIQRKVAQIEQKIADLERLKQVLTTKLSLVQKHRS
jgi:MerR family copper efflux transcriptional regulator